MFFYGDVQRPDLKFQPFTPKPLLLSRKSTGIFDELRHRDILLHHPYDSYDPVVEFIQQGAQDPAVVTMKQTLYRTSHDSPMFQALTEAGATKEATRGGGADGALRRGLEHPLGAQHGGRGRAGLPRRGGPEDALQAGHAGAPRRGRRDAPLLPSGHRQLQPRHRALLHRPEPAHQRSADCRARAHGVQLPDRARRDRRLQPAAGGAADHGRELSAPDPPRAGARAGRPSGAHRGQDERAARALHHSRRSTRPRRPASRST